MEKIYRIAEIGISIQTPFEFQEESNFSGFQVNSESKKSIDYQVLWVPVDFPEVHGKISLELGDKRYYEKETEWVEECFEGADKIPFCWLHIPYQKTGGHRKWICHYIKGKEKNFKNTSALFHTLGFSIMLDQKEALMLHCSFIKINDRGILFSVPSGIGKSTQARLWEREENAEIINGDRAILRMQEEGIWQAFGLPYAGSSEVYRNESATVGAVVVLQQGMHNELYRLSRGKAYCAVWKELFQSNAFSHLQITVAETLEMMIKSIPVYKFSCCPDGTAVRFLKNKLEEEGILWI